MRNGNQEAFRKLVENYRQKVFNIAISLLQDQSTAEDITQEVFITIYKTVASFNERSAINTWIYRITVNKCLDHLRARNRQKRSGILSSLFHKETGEEVQSKESFDHPGILLERKEKARHLFKAIETLPENQKTVIVLAHVEELPQKEIAEIMSLSVKAVESLLQRAKVNLRKKLSTIYTKEN